MEKTGRESKLYTESELLDDKLETNLKMDGNKVQRDPMDDIVILESKSKENGQKPVTKDKTVEKGRNEKEERKSEGIKVDDDVKVSGNKVILSEEPNAKQKENDNNNES